MVVSKRGYLCSIVSSASIKSGGVTATSKVVDVLLLLGIKTVMLGIRMLLLLTLDTLLNSLVCCLQLNTKRCADAIRKVD